MDAVSSVSPLQGSLSFFPFTHTSWWLNSRHASGAWKHLRSVRLRALESTMAETTFDLSKDNPAQA